MTFQIIPASSATVSLMVPVPNPHPNNHPDTQANARTPHTSNFSKLS